MNILTRRGFVATATAGALVLGWRGGKVVAAPSTGQLNDWVRIDPDGTVTVRVNSVEMGQGAQTGFAQILADELEADWARVKVEMAPVAPPFMTRRGAYMTGGSGSIEFHLTRLRMMGAAARQVLLRAGAARLGVDPAACRAENGRVALAAGGRSLSYGELAGEAAALAPPEDPPLKDRAAWRYIGKETTRLDLPSKVTGAAVYGLDADVPELKVAALAQCPSLGGRLVSVDEAPAMAVPGVRAVIRLEHGVAVVADGYWAAKTGLEALKPIWTAGRLAGASSADISAKLHALAEAGGETPHLGRGTAADKALAVNAAAFADAARRYDATYEVPLLSHSPLEPMNATARVRDGRAELWVPTQVQSKLRHDVARALGLTPDQVDIHTTQIGGGFGRRLETDYGVLAAQVARAAGVPVKLIWSRAEDTQHGFYRPATVAKLEAGLDATGMPIAFRADVACLDEDSFGGLGATPYGFAAPWVAATTWNPGVPIGAWRSVDWSQNTFFVESFVDELAHLAGVDPLAFRRRLLAGNSRMLSLLDACAARAGWGGEGGARGVALCERGGTHCVEIVELDGVPRAGQAPRVARVTVAIDPGLAVNPGQIRAQCEGGVIMALSATLAQAITLKDGCVEQAYFDSYPMVHMAAAPRVDTVIVETAGARVSGVGEPPVPPLAPALCNALAAADGRRVRTLPIMKV